MLTIQWTTNLSVSMPDGVAPELLGQWHVRFAAGGETVEEAVRRFSIIAHQGQVHAFAKSDFLTWVSITGIHGGTAAG
jgi:hypothetical protein